MSKFFVLVCFLFSSVVFSLEIDERLTMRIVKVSESKKTFLINRGIEDGIVKGDHAKFFLTIGVVARGVVVKVSPTRSVWSLYRLVNADYIRDDQVMRLKITAPVKITKDESKMLVSDDTVSTVMGKDPRDLGIPLAEGADDETAADKIGLSGEMKELSSGLDASVLSLRELNKEVYLSFHYSGSSFVTSPSTDDTEGKGSQSSMVLNTGFELYVTDYKKWYSRFSLVAALSLTRNGSSTYRGDVIQENITEFGGGVNWYPLTRPSKVYKFIPFGSFQILVGSVETSFTPSPEIASAAPAEVLNAGTFGYLFGGGVKYFTPKGYGAKVSLDYVIRGDSFAADTQQNKYVKTNAGPKITLGFLKRF
jgi:hypothetical protein